MAQLFETDTAAQAPAGYALVAIEQGIDAAPKGLTYAYSDALADLRVGDRVIVPLGKSNRVTPGYVTALSDTTNVEHVKFINSHDPAGLSLTADLIELAQWISAYYCCPLGMVYATMLPAAVKRATGRVKQTVIDLNHIRTDNSIKLTKLQRAALDAAIKLHDTGHVSVDVKRLADVAGARTISPVKQLVAKKLLSSRLHDAVRADPYEIPASAAQDRRPVQLSPPQRHALAQLRSTLDAGFCVHLLHGVTGSGKTEVYLRIADQLRKRELGVIVLVPEIALTPQTVARFYNRLSNVAVLHSGLTAAQRHEQWRRIRSGHARIVVGARSAVFAPIDRLGMIIVDEEHDQSYKQDQLPRYHARDVAIKRAQNLAIPVILGSATPSLESYYNAHNRGRFHLLTLPQRVTGMKLPHVQVIDMIEERRHRRGVHLLSRRLEQLLQYAHRQKAQAILLLNRRGYANHIACPDHGCGWLMTCDFCDTTVVYHKDHKLPTGGLVRCHHCGTEQLLPRLCPVCEKKVTVFGLGTQRVEEELARKLPYLRITRMDSDTMHTSRDYHDTLDAFRLSQIDVLVGTQMIAKGLDFPNVRVVGVISADTAMHLPDFRASERTFQLIAQVAGRAGRGDEAGIVVVQTYSPQDAVINLAAQHDYKRFADREIKLRVEVGLPPATRMVRIVVRNKDHTACVEQATQLACNLDALNQQLESKVRLRGPMPCPIARVAGFHRQQIEMLAPTAADLQNLMTALRNAKQLHADARTAVDVDPVEML